MAMLDEVVHAVRVGGPREPLTVEELLHRPGWHDRAACRTARGVNFFPERGEDNRPAKAICAACPVRAPCRDWALEFPAVLLVGVWGGLSQRERRQAQAARATTRCPNCGGLLDTGHQRCATCTGLAAVLRRPRLRRPLVVASSRTVTVEVALCGWCGGDGADETGVCDACALSRPA